MFCPKCGSSNEDSAAKCIECGYELSRVRRSRGGGRAGGRPPSNHLAPAILVTLFCCLPFGIVAIVNAAQVNGRLATGDHEGAVELSNKAKMWCWISFVAGIVAFILSLLILFLAESPPPPQAI